MTATTRPGGSKNFPQPDFQIGQQYIGCEDRRSLLIYLFCTGGIAWAQRASTSRGLEDYALKIDVALAHNFFSDRTVSDRGCEEQCQAAVAFQAEIKARRPEAALLVTLLSIPTQKCARWQWRLCWTARSSAIFPTLRVWHKTPPDVPTAFRPRIFPSR